MKKRLKKKGRFSPIKKVVKKWYCNEMFYVVAVHNVKTNHINIKRAATYHMTKYLGNLDKLTAAYLTASLSQPSMSAPHLIATLKTITWWK